MRRILLLFLGLLGSGVVAFLFCARIDAMNCKQSMNEETQMELPVAVPGTVLVAEDILCYDGPFLENIQREEVAEVTALRIRNTSELGIAEGWLILQQGERELRFRFTDLPPEASLLVLEEGGQRFSRERVSYCEGGVTYENHGWDIEDTFEIIELPPGGIEITNRQDSEIRELRLYYKPAYSEGGFYLGGITWEYNVGNLQPGETRCLYPEHYCCGTSKILRYSRER